MITKNLKTNELELSFLLSLENRFYSLLNYKGD